MSDTTLPRPADPAPARHRVGALRQLTALFGAPAAWLVQMSLSEPLAAQSCYPHDVPLAMPALPDMLPSLQVMLAAITLGALAAGIACTWLAWSTLRATHGQDGDRSDRSDRSDRGNGIGGGTADTVEDGGGRARFLSAVAVMASLLFLTAILITGLAVLLVSPCGAGGGS